MIHSTAYGPRPEDSRKLFKGAKRLASLVAEAFKSNLAFAAKPPAHKLYAITNWTIAISLFLYAAFSPHSIAITQGAYLLGLTAWGIQLAISRKLDQRRTPVDVALFGFFACCVVSSFLSYDPLVSIKGLKSPAFFLAFYFVSTKVRSLKFASLLVLTMIVSCLVNVGYSGLKLAAGRGLQINSIATDSPFSTDSIKLGDIILEADGQAVNAPADLTRIIDSRRGRLRLKLQRNDSIIESSVPRQAIKEYRGSGFERLGITTSPGRSFRISGFYSHYETYAEVVQLIAALAVGLFIAMPDKRSRLSWFLAAVIPILGVTLILTSTRAALAGLALAVAAMALASRSSRVAVAAMAGVFVVLPLALIAVEYSRGISVIDTEEGSTAYRLEVWREAFSIIKDNPLVGIGKGSEGKLKDSLGLYDEGKLPPGHFHSTPVQVAVWWGLIGLIFYYSFMTILTVEIWRVIKRVKPAGSWQLSGIALGGLGVVVAFNVSSLVHFNFGDGEVVMAFWLLTGLSFAVRRIAFEACDGVREHTSEPPSPGSSSKSPLPQQEETVEPSVRAAKAKLN